MRSRRLSTLCLASLIALAVGASGLASAGGPPTDAWIVVAFEDRIRPADRALLEDFDLSGIQYVPDDSYVAYGPIAQLGEVAASRAVRSARVLSADEKIDPAASLTAAAGMFEVVAARSSGARSALEAIGDVLVAGTAGGVQTLTIRAPVTDLDEIAADPAVLWVGPAALGPVAEDEGTAQILARNFRETSPAPDVRSRVMPAPGYSSFLAERGTTGEGVVVSIADTGIDKSHPEFQGRVVKELFYTGTEPQSNDVGGHGTHVAGIVGGKGAGLPPMNGPATDADGLLLGLGVAPKISFVNQAIIPNGSFPGGPPATFEVHTADAVRAGAVTWNASWNTGAANSGYVARARSLDLTTRDADPQAPGNQPFTMVFSAGNSGSADRTITQPKEAKNIITVASSHSQRVVGGSVETVSSFSSRGPARDGRLLPTVTAPGQDVVSSTTSASPTASCAAPFSAGGAETFVIGQTRYSPCSGTSMAAPHVTGAVALIHDWWRDANPGVDPSPAMTKALLINTAVDMGAKDVPSKAEGWGRVDLASLFSTTPRVYIDQSVIFTGRDQTHTLRVERVDPERPLKVSLVWTDAAGAAGAVKALVNDLDLIVTSPGGKIFRGNVFQSGASAGGGVTDRLNNLENVFLEEPGEPGSYEIGIKAFNLPGNGIPGNEALVDQDFALVVSNARLVEA